ncbi:MAG TPA: response regulator transcription factor [Flavobacterium sp.]|uniref:LytR/AlgR family response regulator transcription factor n=1 Tax=Flavobacterium sp. TaxID=239 RepID=UPI002BFAEC22|nr:response regulator transcription factor [Flavobacterium sp.]HSD13028.1 response regulator transcription factor [Flavobacterium sp.]
MNNTKILIVEDEVLIADFILKILKNENFGCVQVANDIEEALEQFEKYQPDIILLDINVEGKNTGFELAAKKNEKAKIIYITAQNDPETIKRAIGTNPEAYLTKPIKKSDLLAAIQLASFKKRKGYTIIKDGYSEVKLEHDDIVYVKSDNIYIDIVTTNKKYVLRNTLDNFLSELNNTNFCKTHRSFIVNKNRITKKTSNSVFLNEIEIPVSRKFQIEL